MPTQPATPWLEHPRPDCQRDPWINLNGPWDFTFDPQDIGEKEQWFVPGRARFEKKIVVPFPWESRLSTIGDTEYTGVAWYARELTLPAEGPWQDRDAWLVIGACDFEARVWVKGQLAGEHVGGYTPFEVNLSNFADPGEQITVTVRAVDRTDPQQPTGKQIHWYTRNSGIWQTVYIEPRPKTFIRSFRAQPDVAAGAVTYHVKLSQQEAGRTLTIRSPEEAFPPVSVRAEPGADTIEAVVKVPEPKLWSPDSPVLYPVVLEVGDASGQMRDSVQSYFGLREISVAPAPGRDYTYIHLNGKPIYLAGTLHQSFHPESIYQYPDDATMRGDYELCKRIGLNFVRIHIKVPVPRELYWADKLGVLIMEDMPNYWKHTPQAQAWWRQMFEAAVERDFNHPAVFSWCLFNETWGIGDGGYTADRHRWVADMYHLAKAVDPTRLIEDNSPCNYDHVVTDINSWHFYINDYGHAREHIRDVVAKTSPGSTFNYAKGYQQANAPLINSEYGGIGAGSGDQDVSWCFKFLTNELRLHERICGYVYTELSDIEWEHNGFVNYDRSAKVFGYDFWHPEFSLYDLNNADFVVIDAEPCIELKVDQQREVPIRISHFSKRQASELHLRWRLDWLDRLGERHAGAWQTRPATWDAYRVVEQPPITVGTGGGGILGALLVELLDKEQVVARNYVNVLVDRPAAPRVESVNANTVALRFSPTDFAAYTFAGGVPAPEGVSVHKIGGAGSGAVEYHLRIPDGIAMNQITELTFIAELGSRADDAKLDWPARKNARDYPQTDVRKWPTQVRVLLNGEPTGTIDLPDDPADAQGVLSHARQYQPGSYGFLTIHTIKGDALKKAIAQAGKNGLLIIGLEVAKDAPARGGLNVYGAGLGKYPVDPTCLLTLAQPHKLDIGFASDAPVAIDTLAARWQSLMPTAENGGHEWRYTTKKPAEGWFESDFDASGWQTGKGGFGVPETPGAIIGTRWDSSEIWLRTEIQIDDPAAIAGACWRIHHDENVRVFLNGKKVLERKGFIDHYISQTWEPETFKLLKPGRNVIAVHCKQTGGGQNIDVGLRVMAE